MADLPDLSHLDDGINGGWENVYEPREDTFLFMDALAEEASYLAKTVKPSISIEIGAGSGTITSVLSREMAKHGHSSCAYFATDINKDATIATATTGNLNKVGVLEVICADLVEPLIDRLKGSVDILLFNPPYVPTPDDEVGVADISAAWAGGTNGRIVVDRLLPMIPDILSPKGIFYMVVVKENKPEEIIKMMKDAGLFAKNVRTKKARNEVLSILRISRKEDI